MGQVENNLQDYNNSYNLHNIRLTFLFFVGICSQEIRLSEDDVLKITNLKNTKLKI